MLAGRALRLDTREGILTIVNLMQHDPQIRRAVVLLIARGLITVGEARLLSGASRQLIHKWCKSRGIKPGRARETRIARQWRKTINEPK